MVTFKASVLAVAAVVVAGGTITTSALADQLAGNSGFESAGATPDQSAQWNVTGGGAPGTLSQRDASTPLTGLFAHRLFAVGGAAIGGSAGINQNTISDVGLASLAPGSAVSLSFNGNYTFGPGGVGFYALRILNAEGAIVGDTGLQTISASTSGYASFSTASLTVPAFGAAPNDTFAAFIEISVAAGAFEGSTAAAFIDDVRINGTIVPAPSAAAVLGAGLVLVSRRRRR